MKNIKNKKILMTLMGLQIGGAETHVLELSLELKRQGFDIVVASNGGVYEKYLQEAGIKHYKVPLYTKKPMKVVRSFKLLAHVIREEKIDIVHAHGRIPAFICGILHKFMKFTFVTTAHWVFNTKYGLKYISNWGEKVVAVSEDIKTYLMKHYHIDAADIFVTINGIDTNKFSSKTDVSHVIREFGLSQTSKKIVYISRMDADRAKVAFQLVEVAEKLNEQIKDLEIVIVGSGNVFSQLTEKANQINDAVGRKLIVLTGGRTDIDQFANLADLFIGVSRSALEAMACAKPVIVAGNEGYIGIFDQDKLQVGIDTNFCCRGLEESDSSVLFQDIIKVFKNTAEENKRLGDFGRKTILDLYSMAKMAADNVAMYQSAVEAKRWDAVISGYYGFENSGDEALLYAMIQNLRSLKKDIRLCVLSKSPKKTAAEYGVCSINRYHIIGLRKAIKNSKLLISGGGSLLQDVTSSKSLWYYLSVIKCAEKLGTKVMIYANGIGPIIKNKNRLNAKEVLSKVDYITLRERTSLEELKSLGVKAKNIEVTADPALTIEPSKSARVQEILAKEGIPKDTQFIGISVRAWKLCPGNFQEELADAIVDSCKKYQLTPLFIPLKQPEDMQISMEIAEKMNCKSYIVKGKYGAKDMIGLVGNTQMMIAMRLHSIIYATMTGVPTVGIAYDPKITGFSKYIGMDNIVDVQNLSKKTLTQMIDGVMANREEIKGKLLGNIVSLQEKAAYNAQIAYSFMTEGEED